MKNNITIKNACFKYDGSAESYDCIDELRSITNSDVPLKANGKYVFKNKYNTISYDSEIPKGFKEVSLKEYLSLLTTKQSQTIESKQEDPINYLANKIEEKGFKMTFGLQKEHIEKIESEIKRWDNLRSKEDTLIDGWRKFDSLFWENMGKEFSWQPLTLALYYFEYLEKEKSTTQKEKMKELLNDTDELLTKLEDYTHGKDGDAITELRAKISKIIY